VTKKTSVVLISLIGIVLAATVALGIPPTKPHHKPNKMATLPPRTRYLPEYTASGDLMLPKNNIWREWVYVGSPLTPNAIIMSRKRQLPLCSQKTNVPIAT
jgi:hypothetical protein